MAHCCQTNTDTNTGTNTDANVDANIDAYTDTYTYTNTDTNTAELQNVIFFAQRKFFESNFTPRKARKSRRI